MRILILVATLALPASSTAQPATSPYSGKSSVVSKLDCVAAEPRHAASQDTRRVQRLDQLPPGQTYLTVMRQVDGCQVPVLASEERARTRR